MTGLGRCLPTLLLIAALATAACGKQQGTEEARPEAGGAEQAITIDAVDAAFRPQLVTTEHHGEVVVTVENRGRLRHTFTTEDPGGDRVLEPGDRHTVRLPAGVPVTFYCRFHEADGMRGVICPREGDCPSPR